LLWRLRSFARIRPVRPPAERDTGVNVRIQPTEHAATALASDGFRPSEAILDLVSDLFVQIAREEGEADP